MTKDAYDAQLPSPDAFKNTFGSAYWQWAGGNVTRNATGQDSISLMFPNVFAGYQEISYFHTVYFDSTVNPVNQQLFADVNLFNALETSISNYEHLFVTFD